MTEYHKLTVIYEDSWMAGSHMNHLVRHKRILQHPDETVLDALTRAGMEDSTQYIFQGWPLLQGETVIDVDLCKSCCYEFPTCEAKGIVRGIDVDTETAGTAAADAVIECDAYAVNGE